MEYERLGDEMKVLIGMFVAVNVAAIYVFTRVAGFSTPGLFIAGLCLANVLILLALRRSSFRDSVASRGMIFVPSWTDWTAYIPALGGAVCVVVGMVELNWRTCLFGIIALGIGGWRIWAHRQVRRGVRDLQ
jgi:hypothetical protein